MSRDDYTEIVEVSQGIYEVNHGVGDNPGRNIFHTDDLKEAIKKAKEVGAEYGIYFIFLGDKDEQANQQQG